MSKSTDADSDWKCVCVCASVMQSCIFLCVARDAWIVSWRWNRDVINDFLAGPWKLGEFRKRRSASRDTRQPIRRLHPQSFSEREMCRKHLLSRLQTQNKRHARARQCFLCRCWFSPRRNFNACYAACVLFLNYEIFALRIWSLAAFLGEKKKRRKKFEESSLLSSL